MVDLKEVERIWRESVDAFIEAERLAYEPEQVAQLKKALYACLPDPIGASPFLKRHVEARRSHLQNAVHHEWRREASILLKRVIAKRDGRAPNASDEKGAAPIVVPPARPSAPRAVVPADIVDPAEADAIFDIDSAIAFGDAEDVEVEGD